MMTEDMRGLRVPDWFISKYPSLHYSYDQYWPVFSMSSRFERKFYDDLKENEMMQDLQKVLAENEFGGTASVVLLHECGGITLVLISKDSIAAREPASWKDVERVEHDYCYGCSEKKV